MKILKLIVQEKLRCMDKPIIAGKKKDMAL